MEKILLQSLIGCKSGLINCKSIVGGDVVGENCKSKEFTRHLFLDFEPQDVTNFDDDKDAIVSVATVPQHHGVMLDVQHNIENGALNELSVLKKPMQQINKLNILQPSDKLVLDNTDVKEIVAPRDLSVQQNQSSLPVQQNQSSLPVQQNQFVSVQQNQSILSAQQNQSSLPIQQNQSKLQDLSIFQKNVHLPDIYASKDGKNAYDIVSVRNVKRDGKCIDRMDKSIAQLSYVKPKVKVEKVKRNIGHNIRNIEDNIQCSGHTYHASHAFNVVSNHRDIGGIKHIAHQVYIPVVGAHKEKSKHLIVQLDPPELGIISVKMHSHDGKLHITFLADNDNSLNLLQYDAHDLHRMLQDAGVQLGDLSFNLHGNNSNNQQYTATWQQNNHQAGYNEQHYISSTGNLDIII